MNQDLKPSLATALLRNYFHLVQDLRSYLNGILEPPTLGNGSLHIFEPKDTDSPLYASLLNTTVVASNKNTTISHHLRFKVIPAMVDIREVLDRAQEKLFRSRKTQNMLTAGYRRAFRDGDRGRQDMSRVGITNHFVNTIITALQSSEWDVLLQRIGLDAMLHLLTETNVFISLPNGCLCQMTGEPLVYLASKLQAIEMREVTMQPTNEKRSFPFDYKHDEHPAKRHKSCLSASKSQAPSRSGVTRKTPAVISLYHVKLLYSWPQRPPHTNKLVVGLSRYHILNKICPPYHQTSTIVPTRHVDPDPKEQQWRTRHLSKYIFPRQYNLKNVFAEAGLNGATAYFLDYSDREAEIKTKGPCKTPRRLKEVLCLLDTMLWRHGKCGYKPLRDRVCPSKIRSRDGKQLESSVILECVSEQSIVLTQMPATDASTDSCGDPILPIGLTQAERHAKAKPRFADFACSYVEVYRYVAIVTKVVIPNEFWGNKDNLQVILGHVKTFIQCRRFETLTLHHIVQGFSTSACDWLMPPGGSSSVQTRVSVSDALKRRELLEEFIFWYFDSFVTSLLKTNFYVTETSAFKNRVLYFRQDDWEAMCAPLIERLTASTFTRMSDTEATELLRQRKLGFSFVRLLPKETGVRPIVNLRRRKSSQRYGATAEQSINQILQAAFHILSYEKQNQPHRLGASIFSPDDIYLKLKDLKSRLPRLPSSELPHLYFVKMDVQACFDTIDQTKLLEILRELISEERYMIQRYGQMQSAMGHVRRTFVKKAVPEDDHPHFLTYAAKLAGLLRQTIFVDQVVYPSSQRQDILSLLEEHITENIVKIGAHYYRQTVGIPQGSVLSSILCSFFYGDLEKRFTKFSSDPGGLLLRLIDDYLFITSSRTKALQFLEMMSKGHPEYGCFISKEKTLTNFFYGTEVTGVTEPQQQNFPWCGLMINMKDLSVSVDYTRYHGKTLRDTLTIERSKRPGAVFAQRMLRFARARCHPIYSDAALNTRYTAYLNIYQNFAVCAMKMHGYLSGFQSRMNPIFLYTTIQKMIHSCYASLRYRYGNHRLKTDTNQFLFTIRKQVVFWLGTHAFHHVLKNKPGRYSQIIRSLESELSRPRNKRLDEQFSRVTKEGLASLNGISY